MQTTNDVVFVQLPDIMSDCNRPPHSSQFKAGGLKIKRAGVPLSLQILVLGHGRRWKCPLNHLNDSFQKCHKKKLHTCPDLTDLRQVYRYIFSWPDPECLQAAPLTQGAPTSSGILNLLVPVNGWSFRSNSDWQPTCRPRSIRAEQQCPASSSGA